MKRYYILILFVLFTQLIFGLPDKLIEELKLTKEQVEKIDKIIADYRIKIEESGIQLQIKQLDLKKLLLENVTKKEIIKSALEDIAKIEVELKYLRYSEEIDIFNLLNEEQKQKYRIIRIRRINNLREQKDKK